jgi:hypothetical protein
MPRPNKIWFRKDIGWWMVTLSGRKVRLAKGKDQRAAAERKFYELMIARHESPLVDDPRVVDLIEAFLEFSCKRVAEDTYRNYQWYCQQFAEARGTMTVSQLKPYHITTWIDSRAWN